jgi:two-component system cell cycle sensor histidine kinase/response regulator CckA
LTTRDSIWSDPDRRSERTLADVALQESNDLLFKLTRFSVELSLLPSEENLEAFIVRKLKEISGAEATIFSEYDPVQRTTTVKQVEMETGLLDKLVGLLGGQLDKIHAHVSDEMYQEMTTDVVGVKRTLYEASFGAVSRPVGSAVQTLLKVDRFIGMAYLIEGKLYGTSLIAMGRSKPDPPMKVLEAFSSLAAVSLRRKQAEEALRENQELFSLVMRHSPVYTFIKEVTPTESRVVQASHNFQEMIGIPGEDMRGKTMPQLFPADLAAKMWADDWAVVSEGKVHELDEELGGRSYTTIKFPLVQGDKRLLAGFTVDITERKAAEEVLRQVEEQLHQSQKMEAVGQLAGGIAHDFNNLLTAILGYSDLILASGSSTVDELRPDLEEIKRAGERASALTQQILAFSRRQTLRPRVVLLDEVIRGIEPLLRRTIGEDIDLQIVESLPLAPVEVDPHQFEQVVMNLVLNARDAMPSGGRLTVETANAELDEEFSRTHAGTLPGSCVMLRISDTGVGMDAATQERIFEPFFSTKPPGAGTGLGLATVYGVVKQSNWSIFVTSKPGQGSSFAIYLPRAEKDDISEEMVIPPHASARGDETIMVVEDERALRGLIGRVLAGAGYKTLSFASAQEALAALEQGECLLDMLLTDVMLPGAIQGHELALTVLASRPHLPVLYISGYARDALVHAGRLDERVNLLEKPFTPESLTDMVRNVLDMPRGEAHGFEP